MKKQVEAVDLFCGAGGLTCGLINSGIRVRAGVDMASNCGFPYSHNNKAIFINKSVVDVNGKELAEFFSNKKNTMTMLVGCAPCQTFSNYNRRSSEKDPRWRLITEFGRIISEIRPDFVAMENVPQLASKQVFFDFILALRNIGYKNIESQIIKCEEYGTPQYRRRLVLVASKNIPLKILSPKEFGAKLTTVRNVIGNLPKLEAGSIDKKDPLHRACNLSDINLTRIRHSVPGGSWKDWPERLIAKCHKKSSGDSYRNVYGRMEWDCPAPTITTQFIGYGNGRFGHPSQNRALSLREGALLQGFPLSYEFTPLGESYAMGVIARMIGNAVPVKIGELIGKSILESMKKYYK